MRQIAPWLTSVRGRITVVATLVFAAAMVLGSWFLLERAEQAWIDDLEAADLAELETLAMDLQAFDVLVADGMALPVGAGGTSFEMFDASGDLIAATPQAVFGGVVMSGPIPIDEVPPEVLESMNGGVGFGVNGDMTTVSLPVDLSGGSVTLTASSSLAPVRAGVDALQSLLRWTIPVLVLGVGATLWWVTGRAFRPVESITDQVDRITDDRLDERVPVPSSRDEVAHLAKTMNSMLDRLATSRLRQRRFVSDASHELRNPIATSKAKLEVALANPDRADWENTAEVVLDEQERLSSLVDSLLELARLDERSPARMGPVDLDDIVFAEAKRIPDSVEVAMTSARPVRMRGDERQLIHAVRNLIDNASRHASSRVALGLRAEGDEVVLTVEDDGQGIPSEQRQAVFERFVRLDESRQRGSGGAGLGLALVAAVASAHGGAVAVCDSALGGARFELMLPLGE